MADEFYAFDTKEAFDRACDAIRFVEALRRDKATGLVDDEYSSPALTVVIKSEDDLESGDGDPPAEPGVYLAKRVWRDFSELDPTDSDAWKEEGEFLEAFGPNLETLVPGRRYAGRIVGLSEEEPYRSRVLIKFTTPVVVKCTEAGDGDGVWKTATVQKRNPTTAAWEDTSPPEVVDFRPANITMKQKINGLWRCEDTGLVNTTVSPKRRRLEGIVAPKIKRRVQIGCDGSGNPLYADIWVDDAN